MKADAASPASALGSAHRILQYLSEGNLEDAAALSNAPKRRFAVLHDYLASVGADEFRRVFARFLRAENRVLAEVAIGAHHLLVWDLPSADQRLAAQYYVEVDGRFLMDDVPSEARSQLTRVLRAWRTERSPATPSGRTD